MIGGMVTSTLLTLIVIPVVYAWWRGRALNASSPSTPNGEDADADAWMERSLKAEERMTDDGVVGNTAR